VEVANNEISRTDFLAMERTKLANERTFLAYFRSFVVMTSSGFAVLKLEMLQQLLTLGYFFIVAGIMMLVIGVVRFYYVKRKLAKYFK
jgi:putative membrane protein